MDRFIPARTNSSNSLLLGGSFTHLSASPSRAAALPVSSGLNNSFDGWAAAAATRATSAIGADGQPSEDSTGVGAWIRGSNPSIRRLHGQLMQRELLGLADDEIEGSVNVVSADIRARPMDERETQIAVPDRAINGAAVTAAALARTLSMHRDRPSLAGSSLPSAAVLLQRHDDDFNDHDADRSIQELSAALGNAENFTGMNDQEARALLERSFASAPSGRPFSQAEPSSHTASSSPSSTPGRRRVLQIQQQQSHRRLSGGGGIAASASASSSAASVPASPSRALRSLGDVRAMTLSPLRPTSDAILASPPRPYRFVESLPIKILDAPKIADDFYQDLVDWGVNNVICVGLGSALWSWNATTGTVACLANITSAVAAARNGGVPPSSPPPDDAPITITSCKWNLRGTHVAVGTGVGDIEVVDAATGAVVRSLGGHETKVGCLAFAGPMLASGGQDKCIYIRDMRSSKDYEHKLKGHLQEVCGLKWSIDWSMLASGGNDNRLLVWSAAMMSSGLGSGSGRDAQAEMSSERQGPVSSAVRPLMKFTQHSAAIKALAWSPHKAGLLASGGGTNDRNIRFFNCYTGVMEQSIDSGSQVCQLIWSHRRDELISALGYNTNTVVVWKHPTMTRVATLHGHMRRVLYMAQSPNGEDVVTGAGDETLRFWRVWPSDAPSTTNTGTPHSAAPKQLVSQSPSDLLMPAAYVSTPGMQQLRRTASSSSSNNGSSMMRSPGGAHRVGGGGGSVMAAGVGPAAGGGSSRGIRVGAASSMMEIR